MFHPKFLKARLLFAGIMLLTISLARGQNFLKKLNSIGSFAKVGNTLYFAANDGTSGVELWKTDGTVTGTTIVKDINPGSSSSTPSGLTVFNGKLYFSANDGLNGAELWCSDGTSAGTVMLKNINTAPSANGGSNPVNFTVVGNALFFTAADDGATYQVWRTDGTPGGTIKLTSSINLGPSQLTSVGNFLYFTAGSYQGAVWKSDGTAAGTHQVTLPDVNGYNASLTNVNGQLAYVAYASNASDRKLYLLNPANDNTLLIKTFVAVSYQTAPQINNITAFGSGFCFSVQSFDLSGNATDQLWTSDGTAAGTVLLKSFSWQSNTAGSGMGAFMPYQNILYFASTNNHYLWKTNGTVVGTTQVSTAVVDVTKSPIISNQKLYFVANNQLTNFDGTTTNAEFTAPASPSQLFDCNNKVFFLVNPPNSNQLWDNDAASELSVFANFAAQTNGSTLNVSATADSAAAVTITISNNGNKNLTLSAITTSGNSFYVSGTLSQTLAPNAQSSFNLIYFPTQQEIVNGALIIRSNDTQNPVFNFNLVGTAVGTAHKTSAVTAGISKSIAFTDSLQQFTLTSSAINENQPPNTLVGSFQITSPVDNYTYSLVGGTGSDDNTSFTIANGQLIANNSFTYAQKNTYSIRVKAAGTNASFQKVFIIPVIAVQATSASTASCTNPSVSLTYNLNDVAYIGSSIVAVGSSGKIIKSDDDGQTWHVVNAGLSVGFSKIIATDSKTAFILTAANSVLKTVDGGNTWFPLAIPPINTTTNMYFYSSLIGFIYGDGGICKTADGGKTWQKSSFQVSSLYTLYSASFIDANNGLMVGSAGIILRTTDGGNTWQAIPQSAVGVNTAFSYVTFVNITTAYVLSSAGDVLQSTDGGSTWKRISTIGSLGWNAGLKLAFTNTSVGYAITGATSVYKTTDGGITWHTSNVSASGAILGFTANSSFSKFCVVGLGADFGSTSSNSGHLICLSNDAITWTTRSNIGPSDFYSVSFSDANNGYIFGSTSYKTSDGGLTWQGTNILQSTYYTVIKGVFFGNVGYYYNLNALYKTIDGGNTFTQLTVNGTQVKGFHFLDANNGFAITNANTIFKTTNGGTTWSATTSNLSSAGLNSGFKNWQFLDSMTGFLAGEGDFILKTTDGGNTWTNMHTGNINNYILCAYFFDAQNGLIGGTNGVLLRTADGGNTWNQVLSPMTIWIQYLSFTDNLHGYAVQTNQNQGFCEVYETKDGGNTWNYILQTSYSITGIFNFNNNTYLTGTAGVIYQLNVPSNTTPNAGYITGPAQSQTFVNNTYSVPAVANTTFTWAVSGGPADISTNGNLINVTYKQAGSYVIQATPLATCGTGAGQTLNVTVQDVVKPTITSYYTTGTGASSVMTINGSNFNNVTAVTINNMAVTGFVISSPTSISVPVGTMTLGNITVTNPGGTAAFAYQAPPLIISATPLTGIANATITITGQNFNNITDVSFGNSSAKSFTVNSPTSLTAVVGKGSTGNISVTNNYGVSNYPGFTFYASPTITSVSPTSAAPGSTVLISGTNFTGVYAVSFNGIVAQTFSGSGGFVTAVVPPGASSGAVGVTTPGGSAYFNGFTVVQPPTISAVALQQNGPNTTITINGTNFTNVSSVLVGTTSATSFTVNSPTTITAVIGSNASGSITVNTSGGTVSYSTSNPRVNGVLAIGTLPISYYGDPDISPGVITNNSAVPVAYTSSNTSVATIVNGMVHIIGVGNAIITASQAGDAAHVAPPNVKAQFIVNPMTISIAADSLTKTYGSPDPALTYKIAGGGLVGTDVFQGNLARTVGETVGTYGINLGTLNLSSNYILTFKGANFNINKAALTVTANSQMREVGSSDPIVLTASYTGFVNGDDTTKLISKPVLSTTATIASPIGNYPIAVSGGSSSNYNFTYVSGTLRVTPVGPPLITSVSPATAATGQIVTISGTDLGAATAVTFGGTTTQTFTIVSPGVITATVPAGANSGPVGVTTAAGTGFFNGFTFVPPPTISSVNVQQTNLNTTFTVTGSNFNNVTSLTVGGNAPISYVVNSATSITAICSTNISGDVTVITTGGSTTFSAAKVKVAVAITFNPIPNHTYGDADFSLSGSSNNSSTPIVYTSSNTNIATVINSNVHITGTGAVTITASQAADSTHLAPTNVSRQLIVGLMAVTVKADSLSKTYGSVDPGLTYKIGAGSLVGSDAFSGNLQRVSGENAGIYQINLGTLALDSNYTLAFNAANFKINKLKLTVTADSLSKTYGSADPVLTYKVTGSSLVGSDVFSGNLQRVSGENAGIYTVNQGSLAVNNNYTLVYNPANFKINKVMLAVTADSLSKTYGSADPVLTYKITGGNLIGSDVFSGNLQRVSGEMRAYIW